jgi:hypothetical protein
MRVMTGTPTRDAADEALEALLDAHWPMPGPRLDDEKFASLLGALRSLSAPGAASAPRGAAASAPVAGEGTVSAQAPSAGALDRLGDDLANALAGLAATGQRPSPAVRELTRVAVNLQLHVGAPNPASVLLASAGGQRFALPLTGIAEVLPGQNGGSLAWCGEILRVIHARDWWLAGRGAHEEAGAIVVARVGGQRLAVAVDEVLGVVRAVRRPAGALWRAGHGIESAALVPGGACPVVDLAALNTERA